MHPHLTETNACARHEMRATCAALGRRLADHGPAACEAELRRLASMAAASRRQAALAVMLDRSAPAVVRTRAFAVVCSQLVAGPAPPASAVRAA